MAVLEECGQAVGGSTDEGGEGDEGDEIGDGAADEEKEFWGEGFEGWCCLLLIPLDTRHFCVDSAGENVP